jgi:surface antigen
MKKENNRIIMKLFKIITLVLSISLLSSCANKTQGGTAMGAVTGALVGSAFGKGDGKILAIGAGMLAGAFAGNKIGAALDERDRLAIAQSSQKALEFSRSGQAVEWRNPDSGHYGSITPANTYRGEDGRYCREFTQTVVIGGEPQKAYGKACRKPDGQWKMING